MKKLFCFIIALFLVLCIGCDVIDNTSSIITQLNETVKEAETQTSSEDTATESTPTDVSEPTTSKVQSEQTPSSVPSQVEVITQKVKESDIVIVQPEPVVIQGEKPMSYTYLTDEQKRIYEILRVAVRDMIEEPVDLQLENSMDDATDINSDITVAFRAVSFDNPDYFWRPSGYILMQNGNKYYISFKLINDEYNLNYYPIEKSQRDTMQAQLDKKITELTDAVKGMGAFETEVYFHDYLCNNVTYFKADTPNAYPMIYTAYGALIDGAAVCEGYSRAMQLLCDKVGIPCGLVSGWSQGESHMWNLINLGDGWYHLDVTWDDDEANGVLSHRYFNVTEADITYRRGHVIAENYKREQCYVEDDLFNFLSTTHYNTKFNYFEWLGYVVTQDYGVASALARYFINNGATYFEIKNNTVDTNRNIVDYITGELGHNVNYYETYDVITIIL